ncbi:MAG: hypothetical protein KC733_01685, partial [Candidatus Omnitrophica bacterium]|nr:hypothetical protein [Candidatus Omnitrophota bacterium]
TLGTDAGDDFIVGNNTLVVEGDGARVGIGLSNPTQALQVVGSIYPSGHVILSGGSLIDAATQTQKVNVSGLGFTSLSTASITRLLVDNSGNIGIGETVPVALLHVGIGGTPGSAGADDVYIRHDLEVDGVTYIDGTLDIPSGTGPTVDAEGEIAIDTTDDQFVYFGGAKRVFSYVQTKCVTVEDLAAADDDFMFFSPPDNITLISATCHCQGTCTTEADLSFETVQVGTATPTVDDVGGTVDCEDMITGDSATALTADNTVNAVDVIRFDVDNAVSPETDEYIICVNYSIDAQ